MKTLILPTCLALTLQLVLGSGCGVSIHPGGDDDIDRPDSGDIDGPGTTDGGSPADGSIADGGTSDADGPGGADAGVADASPGGDASIDAGAQDHPVEVRAGRDHTCALAANGTVRCWGLNTSAQLGDGTIVSRAVPTEVAGLAGVSQIAVGGRHTCALMSDTTVKCWGANDSGQCGTGSASNYLAFPAAVDGLSGVREVAAGGGHTCARLADGSAYCWGSHFSGQLGDGSTTSFRPRPTRVSSVAAVTDIALGDSHTCAVNAGGGLWCWGANDYGQVVPFGNRPEPYPVLLPLLGGARAASVALGLFHTCARMADGTAQCWGANGTGQLGAGQQAGGNAHVQVTGLTTAVEIACGDYHSCARLDDGDVSCWGAGGNGQLGAGAVGVSFVPIQLGGITDATGIATGSTHGCAVEAGGAMLCWGFNGSGELGDGTTTDRRVPTPVLW